MVVPLGFYMFCLGGWGELKAKRSMIFFDYDLLFPRSSGVLKD